MKIKFSPIKFNPYAGINASQDTSIEYLNENTIVVDGEIYEFDANSVKWPSVSIETNGVILNAYRDEKMELHLTIRRFYSQSCSAWDTGEFHDIGR